MSNKIKNIITIGALSISALLALGACNIRTSSLPNNESSNVTISSSQNQPVSSQETPNESSSNNPVSSEVQPSSEQPQNSSSEAISSSVQESSSEAPVITLVSLEAINNQEAYEYGDSLNISVIAHYSDGTSMGLNEFTVAGFDSTVAGTQTLTITYEDKSTTIDVIVKPRVNLFPTEQLSAFLFDNNVLFEVPSPVGYEAWTYEISIDDQKMPVFKASTNDNGIYGSYIALLSSDYTWDVDTDYQRAIKENIRINFSTEAGIYTFEAHIRNLDPSSTVNFPASELQSFLDNNGLTTTVPSAVSIHRWSFSTSTSADLGNYFYTGSLDEGIPGTDAIEDSYLATLTQEGWEIDDTNYSQKGYYAMKGDVKINFYTADGHFDFYAYEYYVSEYPITDEFGEWRLVSDINTLNEGDHVVIGEKVNGVVTGAFSSNYIKSVTGITFEDNAIRNLPDTATQFILHKNGSYWTFNNDRSKLGSAGERKLALDSGSTDWNITISNSGIATITNANEEYGTIAYVATSTKVFTTYTSGFNTSSRVKPQIYKFVELVPTYPTAVTLSTENDVIGIGKTTEIATTYAPSDTNIKNIIAWSSSNENVATVNNGTVRGVAAGTAIISLTVEGENGQPIIGSIEITVSADIGDAWTIMMYVCGADLESENGLASQDIDEILSVSGQPDDINIILETGGSKSWTNSQISANNLGRFHVANKSLVKDTTITKASMGKAATFTSFMNWGLDNYPAEKVGVIFWNHGGALDGVCSDENYNNDSLLNSEVSGALSGVFASHNMTGQKLEFVGYDACLMGLQDVASFNSQYFNYMIASEESETGYGWDYDSWVDDLYAYKNTETVLKAICDSFISACDSLYGGHSQNDQTLAVLKLSEMTAYRTAFETFASAIKSQAKSNLNSFRNILKNCKGYADQIMDYSEYQYYSAYYPSEWFSTTTYYGQTYYILHGYYLFGTFDAYDVLTKIKANSSYSSFASEIDAAKSALNSLVLYNKIGGAAGESHGLALKAVMSNYDSYPSAETDFNNWRSIFA